MVYYSTPYDTGKALGDAYNHFFELIPQDSDFGCLTDADAMFTTSEYGHQIQRAIDENPNCRLFYATTNRIGCPWQCVAPQVDNDDLKEHRHFGLRRFLQFGARSSNGRLRNHPPPGSSCSSERIFGAALDFVKMACLGSITISLALQYIESGQLG